MDYLQEIIVAALLADTGVSTLTTRIMSAPLAEQTAMPAVTYEGIDEGFIETHDGGEVNLSFPRFQIVCWADTSLERLALGRAVKKCLNGKPIGNEASPPWVQSCFVTDRRPNFESGPRPLYRLDLDFEFQFIDQ